MRIEELRAAKSQVPFEPFVIRTSDGRELLVKHPDAVGWDSEKTPRSLMCISPEGWSVLDLAHVTSLAAAPKVEAGPKVKRKG